MRPPAGHRDTARSGTPLGEKPEVVRVWLLGSFRVSVGTRTIQQSEWRLRNATTLVKLLALAPGHRLQREQVMDLLWHNLGRKAASNNLRKTLHAARRILDPSEGSRYLASEGESLVLCPGGDLWVDVDAFEEAVATARRSLDPAAYRAALALYDGDLLPEDRYEDWAQEKRELLRRLYLDLLLELAKLHEGRGEDGLAIEALRRAVAIEPSLEQAHVDLMRLHAFRGQRGQALAQYERLRETLRRRDLGTEPDASVRALREEIATGRFPPSGRPPADATREELPGRGKHNLPAPRSSFVGRERELTEIRRLLAMTRLLTLTGVGGSGKTRLALEVARGLIGTYPEGVWLVELAPLSDAELVPQAVAEALGVSERSGESLIDALVDHLRGKQALLVLDNCEHLVEAAAWQVDVLLSSCPHLRVLATSREALDVAGEVRWPVPPLPVPDSGRPLTVEELEGYESARLFAERASNRRPDFVVTKENAMPVAQICRRLGGVPLAIELAAARVGTLSMEQISERLENSLNLLTSGGRTAVARQRTIRGALDWSYGLLSEPEQILFRRLAVFAGGWTLEAVQTVASGEGIEAEDALNLLSDLVDKSMVVAEATQEGGVRYGMLEPVRQYALEKLKEDGEVEEVTRRHASYFLALAEEAALAYPGPLEVGWATRLEADHDNLRGALSWALESGEDTVLGLQLAAALAWFWRGHGHLTEGVRWLEKALSEDNGAAPAARAEALHGFGMIVTDRSDLARAQAGLEEALALYEKLGDSTRRVQCLTTLGWTAMMRDDTVLARTFFEQCMLTGRGIENGRYIPRILSGLSAAAYVEGDLARARELGEEAVDLHRLQEQPLGAAAVLNLMGYTESVLGDLERAEELLEEALATGRELQNNSTLAVSLLCLGIVAVLRGDSARAETLLRDSLVINMDQENKADIAEGLEGLAEASGTLGRHLRAARLWGAAAALRRFSRPWSPMERMLHEPLLAAARSQTEEAIWKTAFAEGKAMGLEEAVQYALSEVEVEVAASLTFTSEQPSADTVLSLTPREEDVATLVARGFTNRQIASKLSISEHTAATHVRRILKKLRLQSRAQIGSWLTHQRP